MTPDTVEEIIQVLLRNLLWSCVYSKNTGKLVNRQTQSRSELASEPRANETAAFYTVRTTETNGWFKQ